MEFNKLVPELSVTDLIESKKFYVDVLGFKIEYERPEDKFLFISYQGSQIMIEQINNHWSVGELEKPFGRGINFQIETNEINVVFERVKKAGFPVFKPIFESRYRANNVTYVEKEFLIQDPDGYLLRFQQTISEE